MAFQGPRYTTYQAPRIRLLHHHGLWVLLSQTHPARGQLAAEQALQNLTLDSLLVNHSNGFNLFCKIKISLFFKETHRITLTISYLSCDKNQCSLVEQLCSAGSFF